MAKYSEAQKKAQLKYLQTHIGKITLTIPKEVKERYKTAAEERGLSLTKFICDCVDKEIERGML